MTKPVGLACIDDNPLVAEALQRRIALEDDFRWIGWLSGREDLVDRVTAMEPDILLLDIDLPGVDAFELVSELTERTPDTRVVMFTGFDRPDYLEQALARGAWGYISKDVPTNVLLESLRRVARGEVALEQG
jgi:two-component system NarL family response regulator